MKVRIFIVRDQYGIVTQASHRTDLIKVPPFAEGFKWHDVESTKELARLMLQSGTSKRLFDSAWRKAVAYGAVETSSRFKVGDSFDVQTIDYAKQEAFQVDAFISELVNNPQSKFYIYG